MTERRKGMLLVLSGPAGAGKGTLGERLLKEDDSFHFSVSVTTRAPRSYEIPGKHYHFVTEERYDELLREDAFLEHATVHGHRYGTLRSEVDDAIERGENVLLDIDPQGARAIVAKEPECVSVFILPPSYAELKQRLKTRNTEDPVEIEKRWHNARGEIAQIGMYKYLIVNHTGEAGREAAYQTLRCVVEAEKHRSLRYFPEIPEA